MSAHRGFILPLVIGLVVALAMLGAFSYWQFKPKPNTQPVPSIQNHSASQSSTHNPAANWKTYNGKDFSLKYPLTWEIKWDDSETLTIVNPDTQYAFVVKSGQYNKSLDQWVNDLSQSNPPDEMIEKKQASLDSEKAYYLKFTHTIGQKQSTVYNLITFHNNISYQLIFDDTGVDIFNQILSTFKFTNNISILKTFTDSQGNKKYVVSENKGPGPIEYVNNIYISTEATINNSSVKIFNAGPSDLGDSPYVSTNPGKKYLVFRSQLADTQDLTISDENGQIIKIDLSKMGIGTLIHPQYGLQFGKWQGETTNFTIIANSATGNSYEAVFSAETGQQIGTTKQTS